MQLPCCPVQLPQGALLMPWPSTPPLQPVHLQEVDLRQRCASTVDWMAHTPDTCGEKVKHMLRRCAMGSCCLLIEGARRSSGRGA